MKNRLEVREQILDCSLCDLSERVKAPVPFQGSSDATLGLMGEAPGKEEDLANKPFVGPAGELLKSMMEATGFDVDRIAWFNTVSCFPNENGIGRAPSSDEVFACKSNRDEQLDLFADLDFLILAGNVPLRTILNNASAKISQYHGYPFSDPDRGLVYYPVFHPAAALRKARYKDGLLDDLKALKHLMELGGDWQSAVDIVCLKCREREWMATKKLPCVFDKWGIAYCAECQEEGSGVLV